MATRDIGNLRTRLSWEDDGANKSLEGFRRDLKGLRSEMNLAKSSGREYSNSLKGMQQQSDILTRRFKTQEQQVKELRRRYKELADAGKEDTAQAKNLASQINNATAQMNRTEQQLQNINKEIRRMESPWTKLGDRMTTVGTKMQDVGRSMSDFGRSYSMYVTTPIVAGAGSVVKAAIDWESAWAGVTKTVDGTDQEMAELEQTLRDMAKELPASATEIAGVAEAAGQLGIETPNIEEFTRTMIDMGESTNLSAEQAATEMARLANITGMSQEDFDRLGSSIVSLGNNFATTEAEISSMALRLAAQGDQVGMTEAEIMALAATMSSLGIEAEAGGTAMTTVLKKIDSAVDESGDTLAGFAKVAGVSSSEFAKVWQNEPIEALDMFITGLGESGDAGENLTTILEDLGIKGIREADTILRMAGNTDLLTEAVELSSDAWEENTALTEEAEQRYQTTESQLKILWNRIKDVGITLGEALIPALMDAIDAAEPWLQKIEEGAEAFSQMDEEQQRTILQLGFLVSAIGPASIALGGLTQAAGGVLSTGGKLFSLLGKKSGTGLIGSIGLLGRAGPVGLAIAGVGALGLKIYDVVQDSRELEEANLDVAESLSEQAVSLQESADTFDELSEKANLSNEELAKLNDLNKRISESSNPGEIEELQKQYEYLAEKSGLSKEELQQLFQANEDIIEQSPNVQTSVSETGNEFVKNTDAVREYIDSLHEATLIELEGERTKALEQEREIREDINQKQDELNGLLETMNIYTDSVKMSEDEIAARIEEINGLYRDGNISVEEKNRLQQEQTALLDIQNGQYPEAIAYLQEQIDKKRESLGASEEELEKINALNEEMGNIVLKQVGINEEGEKGLAALDKSIAKNKEELSDLEQKLQKNGELTEEEQERYVALSETTQKQQEAKEYLFEELGIYKDINSLAETKLSALDLEGQKKIENLATTAEIKVEEGNIVEQIQKKNEKLIEERANLEANLEKQGANKEEINKQIEAIDQKILLNDGVLEQILIELGIWDQVKDSISTGSSLIDDKNSKINSGTTMLSEQNRQIINNNSKTKEGIGLEQERSKEAGRDVTKEITAIGWLLDDAQDLTSEAQKEVMKRIIGRGWLLPAAKALSEEAGRDVNKKVNVSTDPTVDWLNERLGSTVSKTVQIRQQLLGNQTRNLLRMAGYAEYAEGTDNHPGGPFIAGEEGFELGRLGNRWELLDLGLYDRPRGYEVFPHDESKKILRALNNMPGYASGARPSGEADRVINNVNGQPIADLLSVTLEQNQILTELLESNRSIERKPSITEGDIKRANDNMSAREYTNQLIMSGKSGGAF